MEVTWTKFDGGGMSKKRKFPQPDPLCRGVRRNDLVQNIVSGRRGQVLCDPVSQFVVVRVTQAASGKTLERKRMKILRWSV